MLRSSPNSLGVSLHQIHGLLPLSAPFDPPSAMLKTSGNVLTLLLTSPPSSLSATNTTSSSCLPKKSTTPALYNFSLRKLQTSLANSQQTPVHRKSSSPLPSTFPDTSLADSFVPFFHRQNIITPSFSHHQQPCYVISVLTFFCYSAWFFSFHSCFGIRSPLQDPPAEFSKQAMWFRYYPHMACQKLFVRTRSYSHQHCQPISLFPASFIPLSRNLPSVHYVRNQL